LSGLSPIEKAEISLKISAFFFLASNFPWAVYVKQGIPRAIFSKTAGSIKTSVFMKQASCHRVRDGLSQGKGLSRARLTPLKRH
jgi:hypothetical protein